MSEPRQRFLGVLTMWPAGFAGRVIMITGRPSARAASILG